MAEKRTVVLVCDVCEKDENQVTGIETRRLSINGIVAEAEICDTDWQPIVAAFAVFARAGRQLPQRTRVPKAKAMPGTNWRFADHALVRLGERHIDPIEILKVVDDPSITRPGNASDLEVRERNGLKAVVAPDRGIIITVAKRGEELDR